MTFEIILTLSIIVVAVILFATEKLRVDIIALLVLLTLVLSGLIEADQAFLGFASPAVSVIFLSAWLMESIFAYSGTADCM